MVFPINPWPRLGQRFVLAGALALLVPTVQAHEFWFAPLRSPQSVGQTVSLRLEVGEWFTGDAAGFSQTKSSAMRHISVHENQDLRPFLSEDAAEAEVLLQLTTQGIHLIVYDSEPLEITLSADKFHAYLHDEGLDFVKAARERAGTADQPGRERYRRNVKTLIAVGSASKMISAADTTHATHTGQRLEITPLNNPLLLQNTPRSTQSLQLQVDFDGKPLANALVKAWHHHEGQLHLVRVRTLANGRAVVSLPYGGDWMVSVVHMVPATDGAGVDWDSYWGNLSFSVPPAVR